MLEHLLTSLSKREGGRLWRALLGFSTSERGRNALDEQTAKFAGFVMEAAMSFEKHVQDRFGRDFNDLPDEDLGEFARRLGSAWHESVAEEDPARLRLLAAGVVGLLGLGESTREGRSAVWRTIRQLQVEDARALAAHGVDYLATYRVDGPKVHKDEFDTFVSNGTNERLRFFGCISLEQRLTTNIIGSARTSSHPVKAAVVVKILPHGERVLDALAPYLLELAE